MAELYLCPLCGVKMENGDNPEPPYGFGLTFFRQIMVCKSCHDIYQPQVDTLLGSQWDSFVAGVKANNSEIITTNKTNAVDAEVAVLQDKIAEVQAEKPVIPIDIEP